MNEIEATLGLVPTMFKSIPDSSLELEWNLFKAVQLQPGVVPSKYKELIGIGIAAATKCRYCTLFHTEVAKLNGATDAEIQEAVQFAKSSAGWSAYINGLQLDYEQFKKEMAQIVRHLKSPQAKTGERPSDYKAQH
jgi:AhpD family alkylhydroperoxidase